MATSIWGATGVAVSATDRIPVDVSSSGAPSQWDVTALAVYLAALSQTLTNKTIGAATLSGTLSAADNVIGRPKLLDVSWTHNALGNRNSATTIDLEAGNDVSCTVTGAFTFTFSNPPASGSAGLFCLELINGGSAVVTWPGSVSWVGTTAPVLTASGTDTLMFRTRDGGTSWIGWLVGDPIQHATMHQSGGSDAIKLDDLAAPDDNTDLNASSTKHGLLPKLSNVSTEYLSGTGVFSTPAATVTGFTPAANTASPNGTINVSSLTSAAASTHGDIALVPKGTSGGLLGAIPDSGTAGGNRRGINAVDWQTYARGAATQVASGTAAVIGGGYQNTASGAQATVPGGAICVASGAYAFATGLSSTASGANSVVAGGRSGTASNTDSTVSGGYLNTASGSQSWVPGGQDGTTRSLSGAYAYSAGKRSAQGDAQVIGQPVRRTTTDATPVSMATDGTAAAGTVMVLPASSTLLATAIVVCRDTSGNSAGWIAQALFKRDGSNNTSRLGSATVTAIGTPDAAVNTATIDLIVNDTLESAQIQVTGVAATTIYWSGELKCAQVA